MISEKLIPLLTLDESGNTIPWTGLEANNFKFKRVDNNERIYFTTFNDQGQGCYVFSGWKRQVNNEMVDLDDVQPVWIYINDQPYYKKAAFNVGDPELHFATKQSVTTEAQARQTADTTLQNNINAEAQARQMADIDLSNGITENTNRIMTRFDMVGKYILVNPNIGAVGGHGFNTVQGAIDYAHANNPGNAYDWHIFIAPGLYIENLTLQPRCHLYGWGNVIIRGSISGGDHSQHLHNLMFNTQGNCTIQGIKAKHCIVKIDNSDTQYIMTLTDNRLYSCMFLNTGADGVEFKPTIVSGGNNIFIGGCESNLPIALRNTDVGKVDSLESYSADFY